MKQAGVFALGLIVLLLGVEPVHAEDDVEWEVSKDFGLEVPAVLPDSRPLDADCLGCDIFGPGTEQEGEAGPEGVIDWLLANAAASPPEMKIKFTGHVFAQKKRLNNYITLKAHTKIEFISSSCVGVVSALGFTQSDFFYRAYHPAYWGEHLYNETLVNHDEQEAPSEEIWCNRSVTSRAEGSVLAFDCFNTCDFHTKHDAWAGMRWEGSNGESRTTGVWDYDAECHFKWLNENEAAQNENQWVCLQDLKQRT